MQLTEAQQQQFDRDGYLFFPSLFSPEEAAYLKTEAEKIYQEEREEVWREASGVARTAFAAHTYNPRDNPNLTPDFPGTTKIFMGRFNFPDLMVLPAANKNP